MVDDLKPRYTTKRLRQEIERARENDARHIAALEAQLAEKVPTANCCVCGRIVDTREVSQGGDKFGCQIDDERWSCSPECWETVVDPDAALEATPPAQKVTEAMVTAMIESLEGIAILSRNEARQALTAAQEAGQ